MSIKETAHNLNDKDRTEDVLVCDNVKFESMLLSKHVLDGLLLCGFQKPSPIQLKAIPLGRCGFDLIVKAKSGTGKTAVFAIIALELVNVQSNAVQVLILAPTREIAVQIQDVISSIGTGIANLKVASFIGGLPIAEDLEKLKHCHIAIGAPGRIKHLMDKGYLKTSKIRLFVLDEADKLMDKSFQGDINAIYNCLPQKKQMIASSATYPDFLDTFISKYMLSPTHVTPKNDVPLLLGLKQFVSVVKSHLNVIQQTKIKNDELLRILSNVSFTQCLVFSNYQTLAESISNFLNKNQWNSIYISGSQTQKERLASITKLKEFKCRILLTTDLTARGIDAANVDLVINYHVSVDSATYLHRMGRAGRYGAKGLCITLAAEGKELNLFCNTLGTIGGTELSVAKLPKEDSKLKDVWQMDFENVEKVYGIIEQSNLNENVPLTVAEVKLQMKKVSSSKQKTDDVSNSLEALHVDQECDSLDVNSFNTVNNSLDIENCTDINVSKLNVKDILKSIAMGESQETGNILPIIKDAKCSKTIENISCKKDINNFSNILKSLEATQECDSLDSNTFNTFKASHSNSAVGNLDTKAASKLIAEVKPIEFINEPSTSRENSSSLLKYFEANQNCYSLDKESFSALQDSLNADDPSKQTAHLNPVDKLDIRGILKTISNANSEVKTESASGISCDSDETTVASTKRKRKPPKRNKQENSDKIQQIDKITKIVECDWKLVEEVEMLLPDSEDSNSPSNEKQTTADDSPIPENIFEVAYDFALGQTETHWQKHFLEVVHDNSSRSEPQFNELPKKDQEPQVDPHQLGEDLMAEGATSYTIENTAGDLQYEAKVGDWIEVKEEPEGTSGRYDQHFQHYSNVLDYYGPWFEDVPSFDRWYSQWREEVRQVRDFVQQNIYLDEMNKYRSGK